MVASESSLECLRARSRSALCERVEDVLDESERECLLSSSSFALRGIPSHLEFTLGTCSGIFTDDTPDIPGWFFRPGLWAICLRVCCCICRNASVDGSLVNIVPRNEGFFLLFAGCDVLDMVEYRLVDGLGAAREDDMDKPGDRGPLSRSEGEVIMVEVVKVVLVVNDVPIVLVDRRGSESKEIPTER